MQRRNAMSADQAEQLREVARRERTRRHEDAERNQQRQAERELRINGGLHPCQERKYG